MIVPLITPGFDMVNTELTVRLTRTMLLSPILLALGAVASSVLNSRGRFGAAAIAPSIYNLAIIAGAIFLAPYMGVEALAVGVVIGSLLHLLVQLPPVISERFRFNFSIDLTDSAARQSLLLMLPRAFGLGAAQITFIVNTLLATGVGVGAVTAYNVAFNILQIPLGLIGIPLGVVLLPSMSRAVAAGSVGEFGRLIVRSLRLLLYIMVWLTLVGMVQRRQVVAVLFGGGFDASSVSLTSDTLLFFLIGLPAHAMIVVLARAFYSGQDTRTPVIAAILAVVVNVDRFDRHRWRRWVSPVWPSASPSVPGSRRSCWPFCSGNGRLARASRRSSGRASITWPAQPCRRRRHSGCCARWSRSSAWSQGAC